MAAASSSGRMESSGRAERAGPAKGAAGTGAAPTADPLDEMLARDVDEKAVSDLVGSLESRLGGARVALIANNHAARSGGAVGGGGGGGVGGAGAGGNAAREQQQQLKQQQQQQQQQRAPGHGAAVAAAAMSSAAANSTTFGCVASTPVIITSGGGGGAGASAGGATVATVTTAAGSAAAGGGGAQVVAGRLAGSTVAPVLAAPIASPTPVSSIASSSPLLLNHAAKTVSSPAVQTLNGSAVTPAVTPGVTPLGVSSPGCASNGVRTLIPGTNPLRAGTLQAGALCAPRPPQVVFNGAEHSHGPLLGQQQVQTVHAGVSSTSAIGSPVTTSHGSQAGGGGVSKVPLAPVTAPAVPATLRPALVSPVHRVMAPQVIAPRPMQQQTMVQLPPGFTIPPGMVLVQKEGHLILLPHSALQQLRPATPGAAPQFRLPPIHQPPGTHVITRSVAPTIIKQISPGQTVSSTQPTPLQPQQPASVAPINAATATAPAHRPPTPVQAKVIQPPTVISAPPAVTFTTATLTRPPTPTTPVMVTSAGLIRPLTSPATVAITATLPGGGAVRAPAPPLVMTPELMENVKKCKNFLSTLVKLASTGQQSPETAHNVKDLVQSLLDGKIEPEEFTSRLQKELKSSPQPYLVPFLKKSLPALRQMNKNLQTFPASTSSPSGTPALSLSLSTARPALASTAGAGLGTTTHTVTSQAATTQQQQQLLRMKQLQALSGAQGTVLTRPPTSVAHVRHIQPGMAVRFGAVSGKGPTVGLSAGHTASAAAAAQKGKFKDAGGGTFKDDDDINDVTSMAGVNINEESAHIAATGSDTVGTQIRSCRDEAFLSGAPLLARMQDIAKRYGVSEVPADAVSLMSHAAQERLRSVIEKLTVIAQHRLENMKEDERCEQMNDARTQLKFFEQLDRLEKQRKDEQEREILLRAAKSRSRQEDPEQARLKQKAKEMQQAELAQMRQRDANVTALAAIGPRRRRKIDSPSHGSSGEGGASSGAAAMSTDASSSSSSSSSSVSQAGGAAGGGPGPAGAGGGPGGAPTPRPFSRQRITRVNLRDLIFYLEQEREGSRSLQLFQALFK